MSDHPILTAVGVAAVALGILMVVQPGLAAAIGANYIAVVLVGVLAIVQGLRVARARQETEIRGARTPDVEAVERMPTPGGEFDDRVAGIRSGPRRRTIRERGDLREMLTEVAVSAVADAENCSREAARERVEAGTWTDDAYAASYLGGSDAPRPPLASKLKLVASPESSYQVGMRHTADAIARTAGIEATGDAETTENPPEAGP